VLKELYNHLVLVFFLEIMVYGDVDMLLIAKRRNWSEKEPMVTSYFFMEQI
jgi:hypothetical protein